MFRRLLLLLGLAALGGLTYQVVAPDVKRYLELRRM
jgi:hypothetical protein